MGAADSLGRTVGSEGFLCWAVGPEGIFSENSRSPPKSSCWWTGNIPISDLLPCHFQRLRKINIYRLFSASAGKQPVFKRSFPRLPAGRKLRLMAELEELFLWSGVGKETCGMEPAIQKKISPVCQRELWRGLALPCEDIFLYGGSSSRSGDEFISRPPAGDLDGLLLADEDKLGQHFLWPRKPAFFGPGGR